MPELQYADVWNILGVDDTLQEKMETAISPNPAVFTWVKNELSACQFLRKREDSDVVEICNSRSYTQAGWHKGNFFYASKIRGDDSRIAPKMNNGEFVVFFARQEYPPYGQTGYVFSTDDLLVYFLRILNMITVLREWGEFYNPDSNDVIENAFIWFYKTRIDNLLSFNISALWADLTDIAVTEKYIDSESKALTFKGQVFLLEHDYKPEHTPHPLSAQHSQDNISDQAENSKNCDSFDSHKKGKNLRKHDNVNNEQAGYTVSEFMSFMEKILGYGISKGTARNILRDAKIGKIGQRTIGKSRSDIFPRTESEMAGKKYAEKKAEK